jgi:hypothetical protein
MAAGALEDVACQVRRLAGEVQPGDEPGCDGLRVAVGVGRHHDRGRQHRDEEVRREEQREQLPVRPAISAEPTERDALARVLLLALGPRLGL